MSLGIILILFGAKCKGLREILNYGLIQEGYPGQSLIFSLIFQVKSGEQMDTETLT